MRRFEVVTSPKAQQQITEHVLYIAADSVDNALAWEARVAAAIDRLADLRPDAIDEDASDRSRVLVHKLVFERTYLIHYHVDEVTGVVNVINFRHGSRLPKAGEP